MWYVCVGYLRVAYRNCMIYEGLEVKLRVVVLFCIRTRNNYTASTFNATNIMVNIKKLLHDN